tara:strand:- start:1713 stop:2099 length:387 start_codon:yes stop_codon:yes gene_type:complete
MVHGKSTGSPSANSPHDENGDYIELGFDGSYDFDNSELSPSPLGQQIEAIISVENSMGLSPQDYDNVDLWDDDGYDHSQFHDNVSQVELRLVRADGISKKLSIDDPILLDYLDSKHQEQVDQRSRRVA